MKRALIVFLSILLIVAAYFAYDKFLSKEEVNPWQFVPAKAAIVIETSETLTLYDTLRQKQIWSAVVGIKEIADWENKLSAFDSLSSEPIFEVFGDTPIKIAISPVSAASLDALFILNIDNADQRSFIKDAKDKWLEKGYRSKERIYNGFKIQELYNRSDGGMFSFIRHKNILIGSLTSFLVEDAIRAFNEPEKFGFAPKNQNVFRLKPLEQDEGNLYLNLQEFGALVSLFSADVNLEQGGNGFLDLNVNNDHFKFSGFLAPEEGLLRSFDSAPTSFNLLDVIPDNVALLRHFSFENAANWRRNLVEMDSEISEKSKAIQEELDLDIDFLFHQIGQEAAIADLEVVGTDDVDRLLFFDMNNTEEVRQFMSLAAIRSAEDSVFQDQIGEYQIRKIGVENFGTALFGQRANLKGEAYFLFYQRYLILSNSISELRKLIRSIENDNTWRKSIKVNRLLDLSSREANYSLVVNVPRFWNQLTRSMSDDWRSFFKINETGFKSLEHVALQFNRVEDKFYTSVAAIQSNPPRQPAKTQTADEATLPFKIITKPFIHRSHVNQSLEVLLQDSSYQLFHLDADLDILWTLRLNSPITTSIEAVDYYQNNKKQYAFVAGALLHIVDRTGREIDGFPKAIPTSNPIKYFSVVDYDGSKNYRFMCTDESGKIYLLDKAGNALGGWNPNENADQLSVAPTHIRIAGKDGFILMTKNSVDLKTRRGGSYPGFPIEFDENLRPGYFTEATGAFTTSKLTAVSAAGEILRIDLSGKIEYRDQLYKPSLDASFELIPDVLENTFLITRLSGNEWEVLDGAGNLLFKKTYLGNIPQDVKFYRFGGDNTLIAVSDSQSKLISIYDMKGNSLSPSGLASSNPYSVIHYENMGFYEFYLTSGNKLRKVRLK